MRNLRNSMALNKDGVDWKAIKRDQKAIDKLPNKGRAKDKIKKMASKISVLKGYAKRMRAEGHGDEYSSHRSMVRKFHTIAKKAS